MSRISEKARRYTTELFEARCNDRWQAVPELARKVEKHSRDHSVLAITARAQARIFTQPSAINFRSADQEYGQQLADAIRESNDSRDEDIFDATTTRALILYGIGQYDAALSRLPALLDEPEPPSSGTGERAWKIVCILEGYLIRGLTLERQGEPNAASNVYRSVIKYISQVLNLPSQCSELRRWTEELLCHMCLFFSTDLEARSAQLGEAMACFHLLSKYLEAGGWRNLSNTSITGSYSPRAVWRAYYETLSRTIQNDLVYHPSPQRLRQNVTEPQGALDDEDFTRSRIQQRSDMRRVEANYENLLLKETSFPKANETNKEVESWVMLVMSNWRLLCGPTWTNEELGLGGKSLVGRTTLDILYRAATKTFHSTLILRSLFTLHTYLGEFELAIKAFDSYVEIMTRGKARSEKTETAAKDVDDDEVGVNAAAEAIRVSCRYGPDSTAEKTVEIADRLQGWLRKGTTQSGVKSLRDKSELDEQPFPMPPGPELGPEVQGLALGAIGLAQGHYSGLVSSPSQRTELQRKAIENLTAAVGMDLDWHGNIEISYALAMMLAETRDIDGAIKIVRRALKDSKGANGLPNPDSIFSDSNGHASSDENVQKLITRRKTLPVWHLLTQLLCAREEFESAMQCCQVAVDQFISTADLLIKDPKGTHGGRQSSLGVTRHQAANRTSLSDPLADLVDSFEKQTVIEMKMTQLSLLEIAEGPEAAVNASNDLFGLFSRMFGKLDVNKMPVPQAVVVPNRNSTGTVRSIFSRHRTLRKTVNSQAAFEPPSTTSTARTSRPTTATTAAPTIQVTNTNGAVTPARQSVEDGSKRRNTLKKKNSGSIRRHGGSQQSTAQSTTYNSARPSLDGVENPQPVLGKSSLQNEKIAENPSTINGPRNIPVSSHNSPMSQKQSSAGPQQQNSTHGIDFAGHSTPNISTTTTSPLFSTLQLNRHQTTILVSIWLFVARLYTTAAILHDAQVSISEAQSLVAALESAVASDHSSVRLFEESGWGGGKSIEDLWADVCNERGRLLVAQGAPHDALQQFEMALSYAPDHAEATVGLSEILMDIYAQVIPSEKPDPAAEALVATVRLSKTTHGAADAQGSAAPVATESSFARLNRIAARDRAYSLLSSLTKLGAGWDMPEAWFALARAYELGGQVDKAKEALWWCVHLEDTRPVRHWRFVSPGGLVL